MTSRERVRNLLNKNHEAVDYIPNGLGGCETLGLHIYAYDKLQDVLKTDKKPPKIDTFMTNAVFELDVIKAMKGDILLLSSPRMCKSDIRGKNIENQWKEQKLWGKTFSIPVKDHFTEREDGSVVWNTCGEVVCPKGGFFFDGIHPTNLEEEFNYPSPDDFNPSHDLSQEFLRKIEKTAEELYNETELSLCMGETIMDLQIQPCGFIGSLVLMKEDPDLMRTFLDKSLNASLSHLKQLHQAIGKYVDILSVAHDFGDNRGVMIGDKLWREIYKPFYKTLFTEWKNITSMKSNLHTCGSVNTIIGDLVECGVDILNPVQISANGMSPKNLIENFGKDIIFWGGAYDAQLFDISNTYDEVYEKVSETIKIFKKYGNYIFAGVHNLPADISHEHLKAMLAAYENAKYY